MVKIKLHQIKRPRRVALSATSLLKLASLIALTGAAALLPTVSVGKHVDYLPRGFDNYYNNVLAIQSHGRDDEDVCMRGRLTSYLQDDCYEFTDEMGNSIEVELDDDVNWGLVAKDQLIEIFGEIDRNMFRLKIDAKGFKILEEAPDAVPAAAPAVAPASAVAPEAPNAAPAPATEATDSEQSTDSSEVEIPETMSAESTSTTPSSVAPASAQSAPASALASSAGAVSPAASVADAKTHAVGSSVGAAGTTSTADNSVGQ